MRCCTKPVDIVAEILSPDDSLEVMREKCRHYDDLRIKQIYFFDPVARWAAQWNKGTKQLERITELNLTNGSIVAVTSIFDRFDERLKRR
jgi:Uma2 family endonuclease